MTTLPDIDFKTATPEQIEAYAAASREAEAQARAELEARQAEQVAAVSAVQSDWRRDVITRHADLDAQLVDKGQEHRQEFAAAVRAGDLSGALAAWISERSAREARRLIRNAAANAEMAEQTGTRILPDDMRYYDPDLMSRLETEADVAATEVAQETAAALIGEMPTELPAPRRKRKP